MMPRSIFRTFNGFVIGMIGLVVGCSSDTTTTTSTITVTPSGSNITLSPSEAQTVTSGATQAFRVTASTYNVSNTVGGTCTAGSWSDTTYTTGAVTSSCTAEFSSVQTTCTATANTVQTSTVTDSCTLLSRANDACKTSREATWVAAGYTAAQYDNSNWAKFSCNVTLSIITGSGASNGTNSGCPGVTLDGPSGANTNCCPSTYGKCVEIAVTDQPDYLSYAWGSSHACYQSQTLQYPDPNSLASKTIYLFVPINPSTVTGGTSGTSPMPGGAIGVAINGVVIYNNQASGSDNIFDEGYSFDYCGGHADGNNRYHYHSEPYSISSQDSNLIGIMEDGYFIYGAKDADGSKAYSSGGTWLAYYGGHTGTMPSGTLGDGTSTSSTFHYHANYQSGTTNSYRPNGSTLATSAYFLTGCSNVSSSVPSSNSATSTTSCGFSPFFYGLKGKCSGCQ